MEDIEFLPEQHKTWAELYRRQLPKLQEHASALYLEGFEVLALPAEHIPTLDHLNSKIPPATGWRVVRTDVRFTDADEWYRFFDRHEFLITNYMRSSEELDWTPEPDMFHDVFGHLPFFTLPEYVELQEMFAPAYLASTDEEEKENIKRLAWYSTEFGMITEDGVMKVFGTGLMSGGDEFTNAAEGKLEYEPFTLDNVLGKDKVMYDQHDHLYVIESLEQCKAEIAKYFDPIVERGSAG
jgi:phenylalanine-4-hydroxylase